MHAHSNYKIKISGTKEELNAVAEVLINAFKDESRNNVDKDEFISNGLLKIDETYEVTFLEDITNMAVEMAKAAIGTTFTIDGVIDTSESAGEYMDFMVSYEQGELEEKSSWWYMYPDSFLQNMTYEEYCEDYGDDYSEEDFEKMQKGWFIVEAREGDVMMAFVPLDQVRTIKVEAE